MSVAKQIVFLSGHDGYRFAARAWPASQMGQPAALILHGIQSHGGWFEGLGDYLACRGLGVLMPDRRGSGVNEQDRGHARSAGRLLEDLRVCLDHARDQWGAERMHVVGISWGGKLAVALARRIPERVASVTLVAPGIRPKVGLPWWSKVRVGFCCLFRPRRLFPIPLDDPGLFTANPEKQRFIDSDGLRLRQVTASFLWVSRELDFLARRPPPAWVPVHLMLAAHDDIVDNEILKNWLRRASGLTSRITVYDGAHHTLEFEPDPSAYRQDLADWIVAASREWEGGKAR